MRKLNKVGKIFFVLYGIFLLYFLIFSDWYGRSTLAEDYRYNLELFKEIRRFVTYRHELGLYTVFINIFGNILIFVPYGFFVSMMGDRYRLIRTLLFSAGLSLCVEIFQLISKVGSFDVDDILLNTLGGILGCLLFFLVVTVRRRVLWNRKEK